MVPSRDPGISEVKRTSPIYRTCNFTGRAYKKFTKKGVPDFRDELRSTRHTIKFKYGGPDIDFVKVWEALNNLTKVDSFVKDLIYEELGLDPGHDIDSDCQGFQKPQGSGVGYVGVRVGVEISIPLTNPYPQPGVRGIDKDKNLCKFYI
jgi:hypothetical protein